MHPKNQGQILIIVQLPSPTRLVSHQVCTFYHLNTSHPFLSSLTATACVPSVTVPLLGYGSSLLSGCLPQWPPDLHRLCPESPAHLAPPCHSGVSISISSRASLIWLPPATCPGTHHHCSVFSFYLFRFAYCLSLSEMTLQIYLLIDFFLNCCLSLRAETSSTLFSNVFPASRAAPLAELLNLS